MQEVVASDQRSPTKPHRVYTDLSEAQAVAVLEEMRKEAKKEWYPMLWRVEREKGRVCLRIPSTKVTPRILQVIADRFRYLSFGK